MWLGYYILLVLIVSAIQSALNTGLPIAQTKNGLLMGSTKFTAIEKRKYHSFRGVRYAKPPIGFLRFRVRT